VELVTFTSALNSNASKTFTASCPGVGAAQKVAIGGGAAIVNGNGSVVLTESRPAVVSGVPRQWVASAIELPAPTPDFTGNWGITIYIVCANVS
jgi:hypothetical protein